jgi:hypothetical protein
MLRATSRLLRREVPVNCRRPTEESTRVTLSEKRDWLLFIAVLTVVPGGLILWQFDATSAVEVNKAVKEEMNRRRQSLGDSTV